MTDETKRHPATIKIEGGGHSVEVTATVAHPAEAANLAEGVWARTKGPDRMGIGFGAQVERSHDDGNVKGSPVYQYGGPVEARLPGEITDPIVRPPHRHRASCDDAGGNHVCGS